MAQSMTNTGTLRWRARTSKEAFNSWDGGDDSASHQESIKSDKEGRRFFACYQRSYKPKWTLCLDFMAAIAAASSVLSLQVTNSYQWLMVISCTLTVTFSLLVTWQRRRLADLVSVRRVQNETRVKANSLWQQNERLYRNLTNLDQSVDRIRKIQSDLSRIVGKEQLETNLHHIMDTCQAWTRVNARIHEKLQQRVATQIVKAVVSSDSDHDFSLSPTEMERLIVQLQLIPGVNMNELLFRQQLVNTHNNDSVGVAEDRSLDAVLEILRQVTLPTTTRTTTTKTTTTAGDDYKKHGIGTGSRSINMTGTKADWSTVSVFTFDPQQLRKDPVRYEC
jgi:hypothetical protein